MTTSSSQKLFEQKRTSSSNKTRTLGREPSKGSVLLVEDDVSLSVAMKTYLSLQGFEVVVAPNGELGLEAFQKDESFEVVITDFRMPGLGGMTLLEELKARRASIPVIFMTAFAKADLAIEATQKGAFDYLVKPFELQELAQVVEKAIATKRLAAKPVAIGNEFTEGRDSIIGNSRGMQEVFKEVGRVSARPVPVLILGPTGSGKELIAQAICQHSDRQEKPFVAVNCASIPDNLIESELLGHERGAFTGASSRRVGRFEQAADGTLFLDEVGDLSLRAQVSLLRVLQVKQFERVGGNESIAMRARIIAATHRHLPEMIQEGTFREDLFYRLNGAIIQLPPLNQRRDDIPYLTEYFLKKYSLEYGIESLELKDEVMQVLCDYDWPGNVRQLENTARRALVEANGHAITESIIRKCLGGGFYNASMTNAPGPLEDSLASFVSDRLNAGIVSDAPDLLFGIISEIEKETYKQAFQKAKGNRSRIADWLGVSRPTVRERLQKFEIEDAEAGGEAA